MLSTPLLGQDAHFSQKLAQDRLRNPTLISDFDGKIQILSAYRQQWQAIGVPFTSSTLFGTAKIKSSSPALSYFIGVDFNHDRSGDAKLSFVDMGINVGANYAYENNVFGFGLGTSIIQKSFDQSGLTFPSQYDRSIGGFNSDLASGEGLLAENLSYFDLNLGFSWKKRFNESWELTAGFGLLHLLQPEESFLGQNNQKAMGQSFQVGAVHGINSKLELLPYLSYYHTDAASETILGSALKWDTPYLGPIDALSPFLFVRTGLGRKTDAAIIGTNFYVSNFNIGVSYDFNISELELASNYRGGLELSLVYTADYQRLVKRRIPCERY